MITVDKKVLLSDDGILQFGKYKDEKLSAIIKSDLTYIHWCFSNVRNFSIPMSILREAFPDKKVLKFSVSDELIPLLKGTKIGNALTELNGKEIFGDILAIRLPKESDTIDLISYKEEGKDKWSVAKVGKVVNKILEPNLNKLSEQSVENFINSFKARRKLSQVDFEIIDGKDIKKYYHYSSYEGGGTLAHSCMRGDEQQSFFKLYTANKNNIKMVILKNKGSNLILGRSIMWKNASIKCKVNKNLNLNVDLLDRIYTTKDFEVDLFKEWAGMNGIAFKTNQSSAPLEPINYNGQIISNPIIKVRVEDIEHNKYPYMDTLSFLWKKGYICNYEPWNMGESGSTCSLKSTSGSRTDYYDYSY